MTTADVLALVRRRWYVVCLGLLLTVLAVHEVRDARPVYWTQAEITLLSPPVPNGPNELTTVTESLVAMAGLLVEDVRGSDTQPAVSDSVDLPGLGVRDGWLVRLPNAGGQWEPNFDRPVVDVQVVAGTPGAASERLAGLVAAVERALDDRQAADGVPPDGRIRTTASVEHVQVVRLDGNRTRAAVMVLLLGLAGSVLAGQLVEAAARRLRSRSGPGQDLISALLSSQTLPLQTLPAPESSKCATGP